MKVEIYGKTDCIWCDKTKILFDNLNIKYTFYTLNEDYTKEELQEKIPDVKTVPQIFVNNRLIGGYTEVTTHLEEVLSDFAHDMS